MQIFLLVNVFVLGALIMVAFLFFRARHKEDNRPTKNKMQPLLPHATWQKIVSDAEREYTKTIQKANTELQRELQLSTTSLHKKTTAISLKIINEEFNRYKNDLAKIHRESAAQLQSTAKDIATQSVEMRNSLISKQNVVQMRLNDQQAKLEQQLLNQQQRALQLQAASDAEIERIATVKQQQRLQQIDTNLDNIMTNFLLENLGSDIDLGAQLPHLLKTLDDNKEELKKELR